MNSFDAKLAQCLLVLSVEFLESKDPKMQIISEEDILNLI